MIFNISLKKELIKFVAGFNYILRFILNCIFPVFIKTAVQVTKKELNVCESYKGVVGTSLELFCNIIKK